MEIMDCKNLSALPYSTVIEEPKKMETPASLELLKMKLCKSDELIKNYNDKLRECKQLDASLGKVKAELKEKESSLESSLQKLIKLQIQNNEFRESVKHLTKQVSDLETKNAGDQRLIQQLNCKINDNDEKHAEKLMEVDLDKLKLEEKVKSLQQEIKSLKKIRPEKKKSRRDQGINTDEVQIVNLDARLSEDAKLLKNRLLGTEVNEIIEAKEENSSSIFCTKCNVALDNIISSHKVLPQLLISPIFSRNSESEFKPDEIHEYREPVFISPTRGRTVVEPEHLTDPSEEKNLDSEKITSLEKRLKTLERKIKKQKKTEDKNRCCHSNSYFPNPANQEVMFEIWKQLLDKDKLCQKRNYKKKLKRCKDKRKAISKKKEKRKAFQHWSVESSIESKNFTEPSISQKRTLTFDPDNLRQENLVKIVPSSLKKVNFSTEKNLEAQIEGNSLKKGRTEFSVPSNEKNSSCVPVSLPNELILVFEESKDLTQVAELSTLTAEKPKHDKETNASKENEDFEIPEVSHEKITDSSPNMETLTIQEKNIVSRESFTLSKVILEQEETVSILEEVKDDKRTKISKENQTFEIVEVNHDQISSTPPNVKTSVIQEKNTVSKESFTLSIVNPETEDSVSILENSKYDKLTNISKENQILETVEKQDSFTLPKEILKPEESVSILEKSKDDKRMNTSKENHTSEILEVSYDTISTSSQSIVEIPKILGFQTDPTKEVLEKSSAAEESRKIVENKIGSGKRKASSPVESFENNVNNSRKMVRRKLTSYYSDDSLGFESARKFSDFQNLNSKRTCVQNLVSLNNLEEGKDTEMPEKNLEKHESSITNQIQIPETLSSFENNEELESTEEISQEVTNSFSEMRKSDLLDDLALTDDEPPEERKIDSSTMSSEKISDIFISNSNNDNASKNFIQGKRSSNCLLTVISPVNVQKRKKTVEVLKNVKARSRKTLLTKIRTLKQRSNKIVSSSMIRKTEEKQDLKIETPKPEIKKVNSNESVNSNSLMPSKKRRIAHTPKAESESGSVSSLENSPIEMPIRKSLRSASKLPVKPKNKRFKPSEKKLINLEEKEEKSPIVRKKGRPRKVQPLEANLPKENLEKGSRDVECSSLVNLPKEADSTIQENLMTEVEEVSFHVTKYPTLMKNVSPDEDVALSNQLQVQNKYWEKANELLARNNVTEENSDAFFRELRSRQVEVAAKENVEKFKAEKNDNKRKMLPLNPDDELLNTHYIIKLLNEKFDGRNDVDVIPISKITQTKIEKRVQLQLDRLANSENWPMELHLEVVEKISELCEETTAAKCIVKFLEEQFLKNEEPLDTSNTPPAPPMTRTQQKIVTLISSLEKSMPNIFDLVTSGINFSIFRLCNEPKKIVVIDGFARVYTGLARLKKDREKARLFCCDALYCLRMNAITIIHAVLSCWPEVLPICDATLEILPKCMAHIILTTDSPGYNKYPNLASLKNLITVYHQYPKAEYISEHLAFEFLSALKQKHEYSTDMAIMLLAKKKGPKWAELNIIRGLRTMIFENTHPSVYHAFSLLGNLLRSFPAEEEDKYINKTVQELCDLMNLNQGMEDHVEGVASALLSLTKFPKYFDKIAKSLLLWKPTQILHIELKSKLNIFFQIKSAGWWHTFIQNDYTMPPLESNKNNKLNKKPKQNKMQVQTKKKINKKAQRKKAGASAKVPSNS